MVASRLANMEVGQAGNGRSSANLQTNSRQQAAQLLNVSERSVNSAKKVERQAVPELVEKVQEGNVSVSVAADVAELPKKTV